MVIFIRVIFILDCKWEEKNIERENGNSNKTFISYIWK